MKMQCYFLCIRSAFSLCKVQAFTCLINHDFNFLLAFNRNAEINITTSCVVLISDFIVVYFQFVEKTVTVLIQHTFVSLTCVTHQLSRSKVGFYQFSFSVIKKVIYSFGSLAEIIELELETFLFFIQIIKDVTPILIHNGWQQQMEL